MHRYLVLILICGCLLFFRTSLCGQQLPSNFDISTVNVDNLSDQQLQQLLQKAQANGMTVDDIIQQAQAKGLSADQVDKLKTRLNALSTGSTTQTNNSTNKSYTNDYSRQYIKALLPLDSLKAIRNEADSEYRSRIFGADLFTNSNLTFEPNLNIPTPGNYIIGAGDELVLDVYGYSEKSDNLKVSPDGFVNIPSVGLVLVTGLTIDEAKVRITQRLKSIYSGISNGTTHVQLVLGSIRSIQVMIIGEVTHPGSYTLPSLATVANALYVSGGPSVNGSFRDIQVVRDGKVVATFDLYDFLTHGSLANNILLKDQDVVKVNPYVIRVMLSGEIKHPAIFEAKPGEHLNDLITYAGGYTSRAYLGFVRAIRINKQEREIATIAQDSVSLFQVQPGDSFHIDSILNRYTNRVIIRGAVFHPGEFGLEPGMTLKDLINKADGVKEDAFLSRGLIKRRNDDYSPEMISFNVSDIIAGRTKVDLQREDSVVIYNKFKIREHYYVIVGGDVNQPDTIPYADGMHLEDAILLSGGLKDGAALNQIEVGRRVRNQHYDPNDTALAIVQRFSIHSDLGGDSASNAFVLEPFDQVLVRHAAGYHDQVEVRIEGQVIYPGTYVIDGTNEKLVDLVTKAGGLKSDAYPEGALLLRQPAIEGSDTSFERNKLDVFASANLGDDSSEVKTLRKKMDSSLKVVGIYLDKALNDPASSYNLLLEKGDVIRVPKLLETVSLYGEVFYPKLVSFNHNYSFKDFIHKAGGFTSIALKRGSYVVYPNGEVASTRKFLFFNRFPKVKAGSEIFVPAKKPKQPIPPAEWVGIFTGLATMAAILITVLK